MSTQARLDAYRESEARILKAQRIRYGEREVLSPELAEVRKGIAQLEAQLARESLAARGHSSIGYSVADFTGGGR